MSEQGSPARAQAGECPDIVLIGHIVKEMIFFPERTLGPVLGSPVAYGSLMAGRLGEKVGIVSIIGTDMPDDLLRPLREVGVDTEGLYIMPGDHTTTTELIYYPSGNKEIRYPRQAPPIQYAHLPERYRDARVFSVVTMDHDVPLETIRQMRALPGLLAVDLGGYGGAHSRQHPDETEQYHPTKLAELVACFDIVRASIEDCALLLGASSVGTEAGEAKIVRRFLNWGAKVGLITLGERGCIVGSPEGIHRIAAQPGKVIDTTGAGDSFFTAFLVNYIHSGEVEQAARFAAAAALHVIERTGGAHVERMPLRADVIARIPS